MKKNFILAPGPTPVPQNVLLAMAQPIIHHRTPQFKEIFKQMNENLKYVFQTKNDIFTFAASGTGAMEAVVVNLLSAKDKAICIQSGKFGERWTELCKAYCVDTVIIDVEWGKAVEIARVKEVLEKHKDAKVIFSTYCETSTGVVTDIKAIADLVKDTDTVLVTDAVSALGGMDLQTDNWNIDVVVAGSQKGLMIPPGLAFCAVSSKAQKLVEVSKTSRYYFDFCLAKKALDKSDTAFTPAIGLCIGLNEALKMIKQETLEKVFQRHSCLAKAARAGVEAIGLKLFAETPADVVTAVCVPEGIDGAELVKIMRDDYGVTVAGGQAELKGKIFRLAQLGYMNEFDILTGLNCLEIVLTKLGYKFSLGKSVAAAEAVFLTYTQT
ncbi:MAG: aminotransferase [Candidatus Omnitrophota bacterium]|nr:MAG: aminotransferase [Candidatus Omnitrophota bacterium]